MDNYYAERNSLISDRKYDLSDLRKLFIHFHDTLRLEGYLERFYGGIIGGNWYNSAYGSDINAFGLAETGFRGILPVDNYTAYTETQIFTLIELFYNYVNDINYSHLSNGKEEYRKRINKILSSYGKGWEFTKEGYVRELIEDGLSELVDNTYEDSSTYSEVQKVKQKFLKYDSTLDDKKDALIRLGSILEPLRAEMTTKISKEDTSAIFNILNNFQLRHNNANQKTDYDKDIYYPWMFYQILAALDAFLKIKEQEQ
ncbi:hypothetical protein P5757_09540 [Bacillus tropicus]|uniref:hypothetical protein n=1 Tax=Bacillus tropicus TaxID=2026188 RepID=UPI002404EDA3|nr:hypothetical protein [Bacillus tropicus]MDF9556307.1 hypothetical protein [Bacillus tropicus]MDF9589037.1 hypothetical protein [Bacillus tropicus]MDF9646210.1 hypothetical protein [Bacillus tropicus]